MTKTTRARYMLEFRQEAVRLARISLRIQRGSSIGANLSHRHRYSRCLARPAFEARVFTATAVVARSGPMTWSIGEI